MEKVVVWYFFHQQYLREPQHTPGAYPRPPQPSQIQGIPNHKLLVLGSRGMFQGYVGKFLDSRNLLFQISLASGISFCVGETQGLGR